MKSVSRCDGGGRDKRLTTSTTMATYDEVAQEQNGAPEGAIVNIISVD